MRAERADPLGRLLEIGLIVILLGAPLAFGAVGPRGRLALELGSLVLGLLWLARLASRPTPLPPRPALAGALGLLIVATLQIVPLGTGVVSVVSPRVLEIRETARPAGAIARAEARLLGVDPLELEPADTLSVDPRATASALRTGAALAVLLLVSTTVAAARGARRIAAALLVGAGFQGLYGLLVLVSGHDRILFAAKRYYLDAATGTFVNKNHFACYLAMSLACGTGLILRNLRRAPAGRFRPAAFLAGDGSRDLLLGLLLLIGLAGLLASFSRAGIAFGLFALALTLLAGARAASLRSRLAIGLLIVAAAAVPLAQIGSDRLLDRYADTGAELSATGGRTTVWTDTLSMAAAFPVSGTGLGTFAAVYPLFRSPEVRLFYKHAHNDLVQALAEGGAAGALLVALLLASILRAVGGGLAGANGPLGVGIAAGLTALLLHSLIDFNLHIPSNAALGSALVGLLWGLPCRPRR